MKHFTKFNVQWGYNNVCIKDGHQWKAAFITHKGLFEPTVMFFSLNNSSITFQHFINDSFQDMITKGWLIIYMDDLLIFSPDEITHVQRTCQVLQWMKELDLHLKLEKCQFASLEVKYLNMIVKPGQLAMDPVKLDRIASWPTPTKVKEVQSFLGFANFYCHFIPDYSTIAHPSLTLPRKTTGTVTIFILYPCILLISFFSYCYNWKGCSLSNNSFLLLTGYNSISLSCL